LVLFAFVYENKDMEAIFSLLEEKKKEGQKHI